MTSFAYDYPLMNITNIVNDTTKNNWLTGTCGSPTNANITYTINGASNTYTATNMWIVGNANNNLHNISNLNFNGELIIKNTSSAGNLYMCFLLASSATNSGSDIDSLFSSNSGTGAININGDVVKSAGTDSFIIYTNRSDNSPVVIYTSPIPITTNLFSYENNLKFIDMTISNAEIVSNTVEGEWMECDNVPIGADTIAIYNLPIQSGLVKDMNTIDSFKTIVMFIVFFIACVFAYFLIPSAYLALINFFLGRKYLDPTAKKEWVATLDFRLSFVLIALSILLISIGAFGDPMSTNTGDVLLSGIIIAIIYIIGYVVIQSKKLGGRFIEGVRYDYLD